MVALEPRTRIEAFWGRVFLKEIMPFPNESFIVRNRIFRGGFLTANCAYQRKTLLIDKQFFELVVDIFSL